MKRKLCIICSLAITLLTLLSLASCNLDGGGGQGTSQGNGNNGYYDDNSSGVTDSSTNGGEVIGGNNSLDTDADGDANEDNDTDEGSGDDNDDAPEHNLRVVSEREPTCITRGERVMECTHLGCSYTETIYIEPTGHTYKTYPPLEKNCINSWHEGYQACINCPHDTKVSIDPTGTSLRTENARCAARRRQ